MEVNRLSKEADAGRSLADAVSYVRATLPDADAWLGESLQPFDERSMFGTCQPVAQYLANPVAIESQRAARETTGRKDRDRKIPS